MEETAEVNPHESLQQAIRAKSLMRIKVLISIEFHRQYRFVRAWNGLFQLI